MYICIYVSLAYKKLLYIFNHMKNKMKKLLAFVLSCTVWYGIISFIIWNLSIPEWHWVAKMLYIIFTLLTYQRVVEKQQSVYMYIRMKGYDVWCGRQKNILRNVRRWYLIGLISQRPQTSRVRVPLPLLIVICGVGNVPRNWVRSRA